MGHDPAELFDDLVRWFPPLFPTLEAEDPDAALEAGCVPGLRELRLHNGTVWPWNRPVYDVQGWRSQLRIENRVLPSGPTAIEHDRQRRLLVRTGARGRRDRSPPPWTRT